jgi:NAD-dependent deacetylase
MIDQKIIRKLKDEIEGTRKITFLVGAGLSAESGIPTFRDSDGYWTVGSINYTPQELGTKKMFNVNSNIVWNWYLNRIQITNKAKPNKGHFAITEIQKMFPDRFALISQNVDGLHFQSGMNEDGLFLIHGDLRYMRCSEECSNELFPIPEKLINRGTKSALEFEEIQLINCPNCDDICRPHVLWFDEVYNDKFYNLSSVQRIAKETGLLFVIGTSGATTLPQIILNLAIAHSSTVIEINPKANRLTEQIIHSDDGFWINGSSGEILPEIVELIKKQNH